VVFPVLDTSFPRHQRPACPASSRCSYSGLPPAAYSCLDSRVAAVCAGTGQPATGPDSASPPETPAGMARSTSTTFIRKRPSPCVVQKGSFRWLVPVGLSGEHLPTTKRHIACVPRRSGSPEAVPVTSWCCKFFSLRSYLVFNCMHSVSI
jgi:hypothetical protein